MLVFIVQLLSHVRLFETPWTAAHQASLSFTISQTLLRFMSIESNMLSNHLILYCPLLLLPSILADQGPSNHSYGFTSSHVWRWELDHKESWPPNNWCFWTEVLEKTLESPLDCKEIQPVHPKGNQSWIFIKRTDAEAVALILWPPDVKNWLIWKDPDAGKHWRQEEKEMTENEMVGWHPCLDGHKFEQAPGDGEGQGSLACCSPWGPKSRRQLSDWTQQYRVKYKWWKRTS